MKNNPQISGLPLPDCKAILICDHIIQEGKSNKFSLIGIFENVQAPFAPTPTEPLIHPQMAIYAKVTGAEGKYTWRFELVKLSTDTVIGEGMVGEIQHADRLATHEMSLTLRLIPFSELGKYEYRLYANDRLVGMKSFSVILSK